MRNIALLLVVSLYLTSCGGRWHCHCADSVEHKVETVDSIYFRPVEVEVPIPQESAETAVSVTDTARVSTSLAEAEAWVEDGRIHQSIRNRSDQLQRIRIDMPVRVHSSKEYISGVVTREVEKPLGWFRKTLIYAGALSLTILLATAVIAGIRHWNRIKQLFKPIKTLFK